jgi:hypothetical protein
LRIHKIAAASLMSVLVAGSMIAASTASASAHPGAKPANISHLANATVTPKANLTDGQVVKIAASKFPKATTTLYAVECSSQVIKAVDETYCDQTPADVAVAPASGGKANFKFTIHTGANFHATHSGAVCAYPRTCYIVIANGATAETATYAAIPTVTFKGAVAKLKVKAPSTVKVGKSATITVTTTHKGTVKPTGKVVFTDNGKKIGSVKESKSGKVHLKHKFTKKGKQHIKVTYSGDKVYGPTTVKKTITVK